MSGNDPILGIFYMKQSGKEDSMSAKITLTMWKQTKKETKAKLISSGKQEHTQVSLWYSFQLITDVDTCRSNRCKGIWLSKIKVKTMLFCCSRCLPATQKEHRPRQLILMHSKTAVICEYRQKDYLMECQELGGRKELGVILRSN